MSTPDPRYRDRPNPPTNPEPYYAQDLPPGYSPQVGKPKMPTALKIFIGCAIVAIAGVLTLALAIGACLASFKVAP